MPLKHYQMHVVVFVLIVTVDSIPIDQEPKNIRKIFLAKRNQEPNGKIIHCGLIHYFKTQEVFVTYQYFQSEKT
jgi:hypothetical protein